MSIPRIPRLVVFLDLPHSHDNNFCTHRVDDVEDDSQLRRGVPVAHKIFGVPQTINSANYVYFLAYKQLAKVSINGSSSDLLQDINGRPFRYFVLPD